MRVRLQSRAPYSVISYKIRGTLQNKGPVPHILNKIKWTFMIVNMKMASFRIKKIWKFRIDNRSQDLFDDYLFLQEKWSYFFTEKNIKVYLHFDYRVLCIGRTRSLITKIWTWGLPNLKFCTLREFHLLKKKIEK